MIGQIKTYATAAAIVAAILSGYQIGAWRYTAKIESLKSEHAQAIAKNNEEALSRYRQLETNKQRALDESAKLARQNKAAADRLAADLDRLRLTVTGTADRLSTATLPTGNNNATALGIVLNECLQRYSSLAKTADGHALDALTLEKAWPR